MKKFTSAEDAFSKLVSLYILLLLFALKLLATSLSLGSGGAGGIFPPVLFMGTMLGGLWDIPEPGIPRTSYQPAFAIAGMAGVAGGAIGAAVTAIVMIFEMTLDYSVILPMLITATFTYGIRKIISDEGTYAEDCQTWAPASRSPAQN